MSLYTTGALADMSLCLGGICFGKPLPNTIGLSEIEGDKIYCGNQKKFEKKGEAKYFISVNTSGNKVGIIEPAAIFEITRSIRYEKSTYDRIDNVANLYIGKYGNPREIESNAAYSVLYYGKANDSLAQQVKIFNWDDHYEAVEEISDFFSSQRFVELYRKCRSSQKIPD